MKVLFYLIGINMTATIALPGIISHDLIMANLAQFIRKKLR
jgi:hypothetical protein